MFVIFSVLVAKVKSGGHQFLPHNSAGRARTWLWKFVFPQRQYICLNVHDSLNYDALLNILLCIMLLLIRGDYSSGHRNNRLCTIYPVTGTLAIRLFIRSNENAAICS